MAASRRESLSGSGGARGAAQLAAANAPARGGSHQRRGEGSQEGK